jgi:hypothetical protein
MVLVAREPDPSGPENFGGYSNWDRWAGINCFGGRGGATMPEFDPASSEDGGSTLAECMDLCARTSGCDGVQTQDGTTGCWLRTEVDVQDCWDQPPWVMYTPKNVIFSNFVRSSTSTPARTSFFILEILLCIGAIALAVYYLWKKKLLCFKPKVKLSDAEAQSFKAMDLDGDGVITEAEFAKYRQERQCGRSCNTCWGDGDDDKDSKKEGDPPARAC